MGEDLIGDLVLRTLIMPFWQAIESLRGRWAFLYGPLADFFWLFNLIAAPGLLLGAPFAFSATALMANRVTGVWRRIGTAALGTLVFAMSTAAGNAVALSGSHGARPVDALLLSGWLVLPASGLSILGFWMPSVAVGIYVTLAKRPRWWVAGLLGTAMVFVGIVAFLLIGTLIGAETD